MHSLGTEYGYLIKGSILEVQIGVLTEGFSSGHHVHNPNNGLWFRVVEVSGYDLFTCKLSYVIIYTRESRFQPLH
jgi:hypothetical protein